MAPQELAAFWSYSHEDNGLDNGGIMRLAALLHQEISLLAGTNMQLFTDREEIEWGDEWRDRIANALRVTTFFIPVITPRYFKSSECRRELLEFTGQAYSLGVREFVLPILYVTVSDLSEDSADEAVALIARMQYEDWSDLRLAGESSPAFRANLNKLARRLLTVAEEVSKRQLEDELEIIETSSETNSQGLAEILAEVEGRFSAIVDYIEEDRLHEARYQATRMQYEKDASRLERLQAPAGSQLAALQRFAAMVLPDAQRHLELSRAYSADVIALNPQMIGLIRMFKKDLKLLPHASDLRDKITNICQRIDELNNPVRVTATWQQLDQEAHLTQVMRKVRNTFGASARYVTEGNSLLLDWGRQLDNLAAEASASLSVPLQRRPGQDRARIIEPQGD